MPVAVSSGCRRRGVRAAEVRADARRLLVALGVDAELSVALVDDDTIRSLNARYRGKDRPTDVLSFAGTDPLSPFPAPRRGEATVLLGDVVISVETAARQAASRHVAVAEEVRFLLTHGILHLLGYDHERSAGEARRMFAKQRRLIAHLKESG